MLERGRYALAVEPAVLTVVANETDAEILCGELRGAGVECGHRPAASSGMGSAFMGPHEVLVNEGDLESARELLDTDDG